ncbi:MAG: methionine gamma-lyase family protein [Clostridia bacterium]|nr:methionine gamma-lyase family protein [Clostridia bacterium]
MKPMTKNEFLEKEYGITKELAEFIDECEKDAEPYYKRAEEIASLNQIRVMKAFADHRISEMHFAETTGYGYDDLGRDTLDKVYAQLFGAEDALVRHSFISGTHTLSTMLFGVLRPDDTLLAVTGKPYDTLEEVIGIAGEKGNGSLADFGVKYEQIELGNDGMPDYVTIEKRLKKSFVKACLIQRSKGYAVRPSYTAEQVGEIARFIKNISPETVVLVDNCYGEFVCECEPTAVGADLCAGSLIKNAGGGLALTGGYIAGRKDLVELCAYRLTSVGIGKECGASLGFNRSMYQGLFMAPHTVLQAIKAAILCSVVYTKLGFSVLPEPADIRGDIIQAVTFGTAEGVIAFCKGIQNGAPVDSFVTPEPWDMPGYSDQVIMAAGAFVQGASIEFSADGPIKPPYCAYMQGGLTYESARLGIAMSVKILKESGVI